MKYTTRSRYIMRGVTNTLWTMYNVYKIKHLAIQIAFTNICERMGWSKELIEFHVWDCSRMPLLQQDSLWNFFHPRYFNFNWYYCKVEVLRNHSNLGIKWQTSESYRQGHWALSRIVAESDQHSNKLFLPSQTWSSKFDTKHVWVKCDWYV